MHKHLLQSIILAIGLSQAMALWADTGVVVEKNGDVRLKLPNGSVQKANVGQKYPDGTAVITGVNGSAVIVTEYGQVFRVGPGSTVKIGDRADNTGTVSVSQGVMLALRESLGGPKAGPRVHGTVKGLGGAVSDSKMNDRSLIRELNEVDRLPIETMDGKDILKAQIFMRYGRYEQAIALLEPIQHRNAQAGFVHELLRKARAGGQGE